MIMNLALISDTANQWSVSLSAVDYPWTYCGISTTHHNGIVLRSPHNGSVRGQWFSTAQRRDNGFRQLGVPFLAQNLFDHVQQQ